jgi:hypothetical protein
MSKTTIKELPMGQKECERQILNFMDGKGEVVLTDIVQHLTQYSWSAIIMGVGALIHEGLIAYKGQNQYVLLNTKKTIKT